LAKKLLNVTNPIVDALSALEIIGILR